MRKPMLFAAASLLVAMGGGEPVTTAHAARSAVLATTQRPLQAQRRVRFVHGLPAEATPPPEEARPNRDWSFWGPRIRGCESGGAPIAAPDYQAENPISGASGAYQFIDETWAGSFGLPKAALATPDQQELAAFQLFSRRGADPWTASYDCWIAPVPPPGTMKPLRPAPWVPHRPRPDGALTTTPLPTLAPAGAPGVIVAPAPPPTPGGAAPLVEGVQKLLPGRH